MTKPRIWTVPVAFAAYIGFQTLFFFLFLIPYALLGGEMPSLSDTKRFEDLLTDPGIMTVTFAASALALVVTAISGGYFSPQPWRRRLRIPSLRANPLDVFLLLLASIGFGSIVDPLSRVLGIWKESAFGKFHDAIVAAPLSLALALAVVGAVAGGFEELVYRGFAQTRLVERLGARAGIFIAAAVFGVMHFDLVHSAFAFVFGLFIGYVAYRTRTIMIGLYAHAINNLLSFLQPLVLDTSTGLIHPAIEMAIGAAMLLVGAFFLLRRLPRAETTTDDVPTEAPSNSRTKNILLIAGLGCGALAMLAVLFVVMIGAFAMATIGKVPDQPAISAAKERGATFGASHDERACVEEAMACVKNNQESCALLSSTFLTSCLSVAAPSQGFCDGVPAAASFLGVSAWARSTCDALGTSDATACAAIIGAVPKHCERR